MDGTWSDWAPVAANVVDVGIAAGGR